MTSPQITHQGLYYDIPSEVYHSDPCPAPSLSSGTLRTLLDQSIQHAALEHPRLGGKRRKTTESMRCGSAVHSLLAGDRSEMEVGTFTDYKTDAAKAWKKQIEDSRRTPVLERDLVEARQIAQAVRDRAAWGISNDPFCSEGRSEVTAIWREGNSWCRARYDRLVLTEHEADIWDWKTTSDISERGIAKSIASMGYHIQAAFYLRGLLAILPEYSRRVSFIFCFVESEAPYLVRRAVLSETFLRIGQAKVSEGIAAWQHAEATNNFNATVLDTLEVEAPAYLDTDEEITISSEIR